MGNLIYSQREFFSSEKASMTKIEPVLCRLKQLVNIADDRFYNLLIAVTEAFNNAIVHGNKLDPAKKVEVEIEVTTIDIQIVIKDQGTGFDPERLADPRDPENLLKENGRGVFIIKSLLDQVDYFPSPNGTTVKMLFKINGNGNNQ